MPRAVIQTYGLTKYYGKVRGVEDLDLTVEEGEIFGFLGPNGAGKTTTIRLLLNFLHPTRGRAEILGLDSHRHSYQIRQRSGHLPGEVFFYPGMSGEELLRLLGSFHPGDHQRSIKGLSERLELDLSRPIKGYSQGMKQKLGIIQAFMADPELLILDEPTLGLDPLMQREFYQLLLEEKGRGKTIFLSSHILPEVERVCDRVGIVRQGHLVSIELVAELKRKKMRRMEIVLKGDANLEALKIEGVEIQHRQGNRIELAVHGHIDKLLQQLAQLPIEDLVFPEASLEDTFMKFYTSQKAQ